MTSEQWQAAWKLYESGSTIPPDEIPSFLTSGAGDPEVRDAVCAMLTGTRTRGDQGLDRIGQKIGRYILTGRLGAGGMGEVYAARDSELGRPVAVKLLPQAAIETRSPVDRFLHEAKAASALNHPNIVTIHEVIHSPSTLAIVMELVDGTPLRALCGTPVPVDRLLHLGEQAARALAAAHAMGIVHCDIKPENLMVRPDGLVKVMDFGLARDLAASNSSAAFPAGTLRYMSPEQSQGHSPSGASDVFGLGIVLYELATGAHPFEGASIFETLQALNQSEPGAPSRRNAFLPSHVDALILSMLAKDAEVRPSAAEVARMLGSGFPGEPGMLLAPVEAKKTPRKPAPLRAPATHRGTPVWVAAMVVLASALGFLLARTTRPSARPLIRLNVDLGPEAVPGPNLTAAVSPDGTRLAYLVRRGARPVLASRRLDQPMPTVLAGTEGANDPFFSPDGEWIGFFTDQSMKKISVNGGSAVTLCQIDGSPRGGAWSKDGYIIANLNNSSLVRVPEGGGKPEVLAARPEEHGEQTWRWPQILPGNRVLFTGSRGSGVGAGFEDANIEVLSLDIGKLTVVHRGGYFGRYLPSGHLVYVHEGTLFAVPMDVASLKTRGAPIPVLDDVAGTVERGSGQLDFSTADGAPGIFLYRSGKSGDPASELVWMDSAGKTQPLLSSVPGPLTPRISPDGKFLALSTQGNIQTYDLEGGLTIPLTRNGLSNNSPVWTADGKHIIFSQRGGDENIIWWIRADGSGEPVKLLSASQAMRVRSISRDGRRIAFARQDPTTGWDLWTLPLDSSDPAQPKPGQPELFLREPGDQDYPSRSPDGRWIAYSGSSLNDLTEAYVRPFPGGPAAQKWQISSNGGKFPLWTQDGKELVFVGRDGLVMRLSYAANDSSFIAGKPQVWSSTPIAFTGVNWNFDVAPDGRRIVTFPRAAQAGEEKASVHATVLLNFFDELKRRLP